jgi:hypothetical protein
MSNDSIKLTAPQQRMLQKAAANERGRAAAGLMDGPKRTAYKLQEMGLGHTFFSGALWFEINDRGRSVAA